MTKTFFSVAVIALLTSCSNNSDNHDTVEKADSANEARVDSSDRSDGKALLATDEASAGFIVRALDGGMMELALGNLVAQKATNARVKSFGEMMVTDHGKANAELRDLASMRTVTVPQGTSDDKTKMINDISAKTGADFEKDYIEMMVDDHKKDIKEFESALKDVKDTSVQTFIRNTIPVLQKHLDSCTAIKKSLRK